MIWCTSPPEREERLEEPSISLSSILAGVENQGCLFPAREGGIAIVYSHGFWVLVWFSNLLALLPVHAATAYYLASNCFVRSCVSIPGASPCRRLSIRTYMISQKTK